MKYTKVQLDDELLKINNEWDELMLMDDRLKEDIKRVRKRKRELNEMKRNQR